MGAGSIGDDAAPGRTRRHRVQPTRPNRRDDLEQLRACYVSTTETPLFDAAWYGPFDIILKATGYSPLVFVSMQILAKNGVLVLCSITGGHRKAEMPADKINLDFVLGNKVVVGTVNASRGDFEEAYATWRWPK